MPPKHPKPEEDYSSVISGPSRVGSALLGLILISGGLALTFPFGLPSLLGLGVLTPGGLALLIRAVRAGSKHGGADHDSSGEQTASRRVA